MKRDVIVEDLKKEDDYKIIRIKDKPNVLFYVKNSSESRNKSFALKMMIMKK